MLSYNQVMGVTVDWVSNNLYWTDAVYRWIMMAPLDDPTRFYIVLDEELDQPHGIAVYPDQRCICGNILSIAANLVVQCLLRSEGGECHF